jgi:hypothetical protein
VLVLLVLVEVEAVLLVAVLVVVVELPPDTTTAANADRATDIGIANPNNNLVRCFILATRI